MRLHYQSDFHPDLENLCAPPLLFRRRPPQSNYPSNNVLIPDLGHELESKHSKGGISRLTPQSLTRLLQSLPPILHKLCPDTMSNYSKAARGLFVFPWLNGIFTVSAISPSLLLRQFPPHCAIRAGRNLPDKEFRYLRTVIVTAAVHQGLGSPR